MECIILASMPISAESCKNISPDAYVIAVDKGWQQAERLGVKTDLVVGDFDSAPYPVEKINAKQLPKEKDDTDTFYAARLAVQKGATKITILGGLGGRLDHTIANLQTLLFLAKNKVENKLLDDTTEIQCLWPQKLEVLADKERYLSLFAFESEVREISLCGTKYPLKNATITNSFPIGVSNEFVDDIAELSWKEGYLLLMTCQKDMLEKQ